jgi:hypothetical protein
MPKGKTVGGKQPVSPYPTYKKPKVGRKGKPDEPKSTSGLSKTKKVSLPSAKKISKAKKLPKPKTSNPFKRGA